MASPMLCRITPNPRVLITQFIPPFPANGRTARTKMRMPMTPATAPAAMTAAG
jgi:hypothetical protein